MASMTSNNRLEFQTLTGLYEPSAIQQLPDGRFLVVEDEKQHSFSLVRVHPDGSVNTELLGPAPQPDDDGSWKLDDLEGLTLDQSGYAYAITSHSRDGDGDEKKSRDKLIRFRIEQNHAVGPIVVSGLKRALTATHPVLAAAAAIPDVKSGGGLNIEALAMSPDQQRLLIGFRSPLQGGRAIVASVENPSALFDDGAPAQISATLTTLDLGGNGIRGMSYIPALNGYLVIGGPVSAERAHFELWFWSIHPGASARRVTVPGLDGLEHAEGVSPALMDGKQRLIIVSDDGSRQDGRCARFLLLDSGQLQIAP